MRKPIPGSSPAATLGDVIAISNTKTHDYAYNLTGQLVKRFSNNFEGQMSYSYGRSYNVWDLTSSVGFSNWSFGRSYSGRQDAQDLYPSKWDTPHRLAAGATYTLPTKTGISISWIGESGVPFEYVYNGDLNGDNSTANDLMYVPKNAHDTLEVRFVANGTITPAAQQDSLENFINGHACLNSQRGTIMKRNSCRAPWDKVVNLSARQSLPTLRGQNFIVQLDIFNFLNLLNKDWGARDFGSTNSPQILSGVGLLPRLATLQRWLIRLRARSTTSRQISSMSKTCSRTTQCSSSSSTCSSPHDKLDTRSGGCLRHPPLCTSQHSHAAGLAGAARTDARANHRLDSAANVEVADDLHPASASSRWRRRRGFDSRRARRKSRHRESSTDTA